MYLKELTLKGFKSFASATTLRFEPGITAVVGPNGSGKSNIVDALTWVMGEQGARNLRGSSMEDVIFAGTASRPPLGRAQVSLTIDNADHALGIDYAEVTISRTIFRNGGSEYAINGTPCRLLDVQELLSDTGLGQQMHVIVGQGRLDAILRADPAGNRAFIEEAAGILKHRKRKERALRKLANTETNLSRLDDLLGEIRRQMGPLDRQARVSRRADAIQVSLRDAQARLLADDAARAAAARADVRAELTRVRADLAASRRDLAHVKVRIEQVEAAAGASSPAIDRVNQTWRSLSQTKERLDALASLAAERARAVAGRIAAEPGEDPDLLERRATELDSQAKAQAAAVDDARLTLDQATEARADHERRLAAVRQTLTELRRDAKERDGRIAGLKERIAREEAAVQSADTRSKDFAAQRAQLATQRDEAQADRDRLEAEASAGDGDDGAALDAARASLAERREALDAMLERQRELQSRIVSLDAKADALRDTLDSRDASGSLADDASVGALGPLTDFIRVADGWEDAVARALGQFAGATVVPGEDGLLRALDLADERRLGATAVIRPLTVDGTDASDDTAGITAPCPLGALVHPNPEAADGARACAVAAAVRALLRGAMAAPTARDAQRMTAAGECALAVTRGGEVFAAGVAAAGGSGLAHSGLALAARRDQALAQAKALRAEAGDLDREVDAARAARDEAARAVDAETTRRTEARLRAEQSARALKTAAGRLAGLDRQIADLDAKTRDVADGRADHATRLDDLAQALAAAQQAGDGRADSEALAERERTLEQALDALREREVTAKLAWGEATRTAESLARQAGLLHANAREAAERRERIDRRNRRLKAQAGRLEGIARDATAVAAMAADAIAGVVSRREALQAEASGHDAELKELRARRDAIEPTVTELTGREHALDVTRERLATEHGQLAQRATDELGMDLETLVRDYGPEVPVPLLDDDGNPIPVDDGATDGEVVPDGPVVYRTAPYVRAEQERRLEKARRDLKALGKVNPLATEEYDALRERNQYLAAQRDDVARSRDDLMRLVKDLDGTMTEVFRSAFEDTAAAFERVFATLFPGGKGRLRLEDPEDLRATGVIVEASPAGKRVKQLSLLSGGERSLTALALLFAIFTARPSPFYVMDEVEAALDDVNLTRLLDALRQLREHAQLIVITHQQRTMAIADALYGVTMRTDGVTTVVSQRLRHS
ncbi:chromosome segregation protein SMC [Bifidobacterium pullorum subsp. saeculare]|uniref:Chromosome partition protein Smc n=1 Tax=Bifidobacterium pullorum subsp. saeculare TaxID=78257 RepID=A0A938WYE8_9BIFI|nr:chromosome segregation protein SMC [Bifidobacterium pullorum]MBM6698967.1 chromosome segregation protein SMC [Bifidobacterium pullorum subsp. saeculare]